MASVKHSEEGALQDAEGKESYWIFGEEVTAEEYWKRMPVRSLTPTGEEWRLQGNLHRMYGPAVTRQDGEKEYWVYGQRLSEEEFRARVSRFEWVQSLSRGRWSQTPNLDSHREDGPAFYDSTCKIWCLHGETHRDGGPAVLNTGNTWFIDSGIRWDPGDRGWLVRGKLHREDGPAIERASGGVEYWVNGKRHRDGGPSVINVNNVKEAWHQNGLAHRPEEDGPAITYVDGRQEYISHDKTHREKGPAVITSSRMEWWREGKIHREDGPAIINENSRLYYLNGLMTEVTRYVVKGSVQWKLGDLLHRDNGPAYISDEGCMCWYKGGKIHRDKGPAVFNPKIDGAVAFIACELKITLFPGDQVWAQNGQIHREDGPAVVRDDGTEEWWVHGVRIDGGRRGVLSDLAIKAKWDCLVGVLGAALGVDTSHDAWRLLMKAALAVIVHHKSSSPLTKIAAETALRVTFTEMGFTMLEKMVSAVIEDPEAVDMINDVMSSTTTP